MLAPGGLEVAELTEDVEAGDGGLAGELAGREATLVAGEQLEGARAVAGEQGGAGGLEGDKLNNKTQNKSHKNK